MPIDPRAYKGKRIAPLPYDENSKPIPALFIPIVDLLTSEITGYLPLNAADQGDGTATLRVETDLGAEMVALEDGLVFSSIISRVSAGAPENMALFVVGAKPVHLRRLDIDFGAAGSTLWQLYLNPAVTVNGTAVVATNRSTASVMVPTAVLYDTPTVTALGTLINGFLTTATVQVPLQPIDSFWKLHPGDSLLIRRLNVGAGAQAVLRVRWSEV